MLEGLGIIFLIGLIIGFVFFIVRGLLYLFRL